MAHLASTQAAGNGRSDDGLAGFLQSATGVDWILICGLILIIPSFICLFGMALSPESILSC
jgi:hypothetical protein